jgi:hypothetical protein
MPPSYGHLSGTRSSNTHSIPGPESVVTHLLISVKRPINDLRGIEWARLDVQLPMTYDDHLHTGPGLGFSKMKFDGRNQWLLLGGGQSRPIIYLLIYETNNNQYNILATAIDIYSHK